MRVRGNAEDVEYTVFGRTMITFTLRAMFVAQLLLLIVGPLTVFGPLVWVFWFAKKGAAWH